MKGSEHSETCREIQPSLSGTDSSGCHADCPARPLSPREALEEISVGLQWWLENHGDRGGHLVGLLEIAHNALGT